MALETFTLQSRAPDLQALWSQAPVEIWSAGAAVGSAPPSFSSQEGHLLLVRGRLRLDPELTLEGPALAFVDPGGKLQLEALDPSVRVLLWSIHTQQQRAGASGRGPRVLGRADLEEPRTVTTAAALVHWLPRLRAPARRTLAGAPTLVLNLGHAPLPLVVGDALLPLPGGTGAVTTEVVSLNLRPGCGPLVAVEQIDLAP